MTTTNVYQGMDLDKPSSKVLAPPGGRSNICFGGDPEPQQQQQQRTQPKQERAAPVQQSLQQDTGPAKSCKPQSQSTGFNLLTGEPLAPSQNGGRRGQQRDRVDPANMPAAGSRLEDRQVTRKNPPGGASSFQFGN